MGARVLVIEDNKNNLDLIAYLLGAFGHTVMAARDGETGLEAVQAHRPDLIVCDLHLPGITGYEVARRLKLDPALRSIPLVAVTALAMVGDRDKVLAAGFDGYLSKPIDPEKFIEQIDRFLPVTVRSTTPAAPAAAAPADRPRETWTSATVLVVDNVGENVTLLYSLLGGLGLRLLSARSVPEALGLARELKPDLIISDIHMPHQDGFDFMRAVKIDPALRATPFVFVTASARYEADEMTAIALGAAAVIARDTEATVLRRRILACLPRDLRPAGFVLPGT